jgi:hypothetical protein
MLYWLNTTYACGGVLVDTGGRVTGACPIYHWMIGQPWSAALAYLRRTGNYIAHTEATYEESTGTAGALDGLASEC